MFAFDFTTNLAPMLTLIAATSAAIVSIINALKSTKRNDIADEKADNTNLKLDANSYKLDTIHSLANGNLSEVKNELKTLQIKFDALEEQAGGLRDTVHKLATCITNCPLNENDELKKTIESQIKNT